MLTLGVPCARAAQIDLTRTWTVPCTSGATAWSSFPTSTSRQQQSSRASGAGSGEAGKQLVDCAVPRTGEAQIPARPHFFMGRPRGLLMAMSNSVPSAGLLTTRLHPCSCSQGCAAGTVDPGCHQDVLADACQPVRGGRAGRAGHWRLHHRLARQRYRVQRSSHWCRRRLQSDYM